MVFFSLFVITAVILGAGAMLAPAWPSSAPRIGLSATLLLGIVSGGAVWWASLFGWDTLIIDYLLFAIVSGVILGGTLSKGGDGGWPSRKELAFFAVVALICMMPLFVLLLPLGENAPSDALFSLAVRESGSFTSLPPFFTYMEGFAPPAFHALAAYLSQQLQQDIPTIHMALGALIAFLCVWTVFDLGAEIKNKRLGYSMAVSLLASFGMLGLLWRSYYSQLMGVLFAFAFIAYGLRYYRQHKWIDMIAAGLMLGAVLYCSPILFATCLGSYYLLIFFMALPFRQASKYIAQWTIYSRLGLWFGILVFCLSGTGLWIIRNGNYLYRLYYVPRDLPYNDFIMSDDRGIWLLGIYTIGASILGGFGLARLTKSFEPGRFVYGLIPLILLGIIGTSFYLNKTLVQAASENDIAAMQWISENTTEDAYILNGVNEFWTMPMVNRSVGFHPYLTYLSRISSDCCGFEGALLAYIWEQLAENKYVLSPEDRVDYVLVPDGLDFPLEVEGLRLVFEQGGARVYEVIP